MAVMSAQLPLPTAPPETVPVGMAAALAERGEGGVVFLHGEVSFAWDASDEASRRLAAVQLVRIKAAKAVEVAAAFGVSSVTLWQWGRAFADRGVAGLVPRRSGPKGPTKLTDALAARIRELRDQGQTLAQIAAATGVSTFTVRTALGRTGESDERGGSAAEGEPGGDILPGTGRDADSGMGPQASADTDADTDSAAEGPERGRSADADASAQAGLPVVPDPAPRQGERALARFGLLSEAAPVFTEGRRLPLAGLLLVLPTLQATGLLEAAGEVYGRLRNGFYGLQSMFLTLVFLALVREPRAEGATRLPPADLGRVLGLDRGPEVKTIRRKLAELARPGKAAELIEHLARAHVTHRPEAVGYLYVDGHVRVYSGTRSLPKTHVARMRISTPATVETWVADADGDPVLVVPAAAADSLVTELLRLAGQIRSVVGDRRVTVCFDRGGYSPDTFARLLAADFDVVTYRKGRFDREPDTAFATHQYRDEHGRVYEYELVDREVSFDLPNGGPHGNAVTLRQLMCRSAAGHQIPILTSRCDLDAAEVAYRMFHRWRLENYFRYARGHFALDALDSYAAIADDPARSVPNPAKATARKNLAAARTALADAQAGYAHAIDATATQLRATGGSRATVDPAAAEPVTAARAALADAQARLDAIPARVPLSEVDPDAQVLKTETKLITHAARMSAYNAESALARALHGNYARADDEARALLREAFHTTGDIHIDGDTLQVRLEPLSAPRRSRALAALCRRLTDTETHYPGTSLRLVYTVKNHPSTN